LNGYDPKLLDHLSERLMKIDGQMNVKILTSLLKSTTESRYDNPALYNYLTE